MTQDSDWDTRRRNNRTLKILDAAEKGNYGVLAVVAYNIEHIVGFVKAAEQSHSPLIIQFFPWAIHFSELLIRAAADAARHAAVPISIHLDHAQEPEQIRYAAAHLPFDSIMIDMSHYGKEENLAKTRELVAFCHNHDVATKAEPGRIEGGEDGVMDTEGLEAIKTTLEVTSDFMATGVDILAPAIGNLHGESPYGLLGPQLDLERLGQIRYHLDGEVRIALHGTNTFTPELMKRCVATGVSKINANRLVLDDYLEHLKSEVSNLTTTALMEAGVQKIAQQTMEWMEVCGCAGKAGDVAGQ